MRFVAGGSIGQVVYYLGLYLLTEHFGLWYLLSATIFTTVNLGINFVLHKYWTFGNKSNEKLFGQIILYVTASTVRSVSNITLLYLLVEFAHLHYLQAQLILTAIFAVVGFIVVRWIFKNQSIL